MKNKTKLGLAGIVLSATILASGCSAIKSHRIRAEEPDLYQKYKQIDLSEISEGDQIGLNKMHEEYGKGTIHSDKLRKKYGDEFVDAMVSLTGKKEFTDRELYLLNKVSRDVAGSLMTSH